MKTESLRAIRKSLAPNPKEIPIIKSQTKTSPGRSQFWSFGLGTYLGFGIWCLELLFSQNSFAQGPLIPPAGPPAPTMKTLTEVEPRANLQATSAPPGVDTTNASYHFIINQPGSYFLSANLGVTKPNGIQINAEGVTLDLSGFQISRTSGSGGHGIEIAATSHRASIRDGSIKGFNYGIRSISVGSPASACSFRDLAVSGCTNTGIGAGEGAVLEACRVHENTGLYGINTFSGATLVNCTAANNTSAFAGISTGGGSSLLNCSAYNNTTNAGIFANVGSSLTNCAAYSNDGTGAVSSGIQTSVGCSITHCSTRENKSAAPATTTTGIGFDVGPGNTIQGCTANNNRGDGIRISHSTVARENTSSDNGSSGDGAGIHSTESDNRIEGNNVRFNDRGIDADVGGNLVIKNSATSNTASNYDLAENNRYGPIIDLTAFSSATATGNSAPSTLISTDPWANFAY